MHVQGQQYLHSPTKANMVTSKFYKNYVKKSY